MSQNPDDSSTATGGVRSLAVLGTGSDVGKSTIAAGLCRLLANHGVRVAPFKGQNMSNNSQPALRPDGTYGEIGTAQAIQAEASRIPPRVEMNPVLLKSGGRRDSDGAYLCSVLVLGQTLAVEDYGALGQRTEELRSLVLDAHQRLADVTDAQVIILEGAGSCTELNLMERDIVNLPLVRKLKPACPWLLVANIDPGGVFAQVVGTKACLSPEDWDQCCGVVINRLRGEAKYFEPGPSILEKMVGKPIYVVPFVYDMNLPEEDGLGVERRLVNELSERTGTTSQQKPVVVIIAYPHISITSDFTPLENDDAYEVVWRRNGPPPRPYPETAAVILPGSRLTRLDLEWLRSRPDWIAFLHTHVERGGVLLGLCGGYQMLGMNVSDPDGIEGDSGTSVGLGFLPVETVIAPVVSKIVTPRVGYLRLPSPTEEQDNQPLTSKNDGSSIVANSDDRVSVQGFELRCGRTVNISHDNDDNHNFGKFDADVAPLLQLTTREPRDHDTDNDRSDAEEENEGMRKGNIYGTYLHGILASRRARHALLSGIHRYQLAEDVEVDNGQDPLDKFANHLESCGLDYDTVWSMIHGTNE
eukprot:scaffold9421_cov47-Attheya_sp.AAC.2